MRTLIYLDHSATTKPDAAILQTFLAVNEDYWFNPASIHKGGDQAANLLERAREQVATLLKTPSKSVIFTSGGTEGNNYVLRGAEIATKSRGKHILVSSVEHPSVLETAKVLQNEGFDVEWIAVDSNGQVCLADLDRKVRNDTILVSIQHVNNEIGTIQPIVDSIDIIRTKSRAIIHMDAVQSYGKLQVDFDKYPVDWITLSSHKFHGIKGSGVAASRNHITLPPYIHGGGQEHGHRSGTTPVAQAVSTAKSMRLAANEQQATFKHLDMLQKELRKFFEELSAVNILTPDISAPHILTVAVRGVKGEVLVNALEKREIYVSTSSACSSKKKGTSHVLEAMNLHSELIDGVIRISTGKHTSIEEIEQFKLHFTHVMKQLERNVKS
ncbi:cysteine desulfurase family protein [Chryseomicrobium palamuruense]|uniref:Cysteine desulfurase family protein n=1 Tax=Chryseomicrobium palamuruense TaxID=682973 RepID=A0ABV8UYV0_9BACL